MRQDDLRDLREQRKRIHNDMLALVDQAEKEKRDFNAEDQKAYDEMVEEFNGLEHRIRRGAQQAGFAKDIEEEKTVSWMPVDSKAPDNLAEYRAQSGHHKYQDDPEYRQAFYHWLSARKPDSELEVEEFRVLNKTTTTAGGFLVPTSMTDSVLRALRFQGSVKSLANVITTGGGENLLYPVNSAHGVATWTAESVAYTLSDETFAQITLSAFKAGTIVKVTEELLEDSAFPLDGFLATEFGERVATLEETAFMIGDGSGKPQGLLATSATANITLVTAAVGNSLTFTYDALVGAVFTAGLVPYRDNCSWIVSNGAAMNMYLMKDSQLRPLWHVNIAADGPDTFLGYPINVHPDVPAPGVSVISVLFGDWKRAYTIREVDGFQMMRLPELYAEAGQVGFRGHHRVDGRVTLAAAGIALKHSAT